MDLQKRLLLFFLLALQLVAVPLRSKAATLTVKTLSDGEPNSLRQVISGSAPGDTINFAVKGTIVLTNTLIISKDLTVIGPAWPGIRISGDNTYRVLVIAAGLVNISGLTIANGNTPSYGAGIYISWGALLKLESCTVSSNISGDSGGGVANNGSLLALNCTFSCNQANQGGGVYTYGGLVFLRNSTVVSNTATVGGGGIFNYPFPGTSHNISSTLVAGNTAPNHADVIGAFTSGGYNLIGSIDYSSGPYGVSTSGLIDGINNDLVGSLASPIDPLIGPLQANGGPAFTHALKPGSPAIDAGISNGLATDQRGAPRAFLFGLGLAAIGDSSDIGAFEFGRPRLDIARVAGQVVLSWPACYGDFTVQTTTNTDSSAIWIVAIETPAILGNRFNLTNTSPANNLFFRLLTN